MILLQGDPPARLRVFPDTAARVPGERERPPAARQAEHDPPPGAQAEVRAGNEPSRSLLFHNHGEGLY